MHNHFSANTFSSLEDALFSIKNYSRLKFGSTSVARIFGIELADKFFQAHAGSLLAERCVVIPSPFNHVQNAATLLTHEFINRLNHLLVNANGTHVEYDVIHRKVSYISDYGFLDADKRKELIDNDSFYLNAEFYQGKTLIFVDDVRITGTHENKLKEVLENNDIYNDCHFIYYGDYVGTDPTIESKINFAALPNGIHDFAVIAQEEGHQMIVRPLKFILSQHSAVVHNLMGSLSDSQIRAIYNGCLGEGYYMIPSYQEAFKVISGYFENL